MSRPRFLLFAAALVSQGAIAQSPFADARTEALVREAQARHRARGEDLSGYTADVLTRSEGTVGASRWAPDVTVVVHELLARVHWQRPNDLRIDVRGARNRSVRLPGVSARDVAGFWTETFAGEPWFAPRFPGDDIELTGIPDEPARHPLAPDGERWYRYAIADSSTLVLVGRTVRAIAVAVTPARPAPFPLLTGQLWIDRDTHEVVRLAGALSGPGLWEDDDDESPVLVGIALDLEYALHQGRWWLPSRQVVVTHWTYRYLPGAQLTGIATTSFANHRLAPDSSLVFQSAGGRRRGRNGLVRSRHRGPEGRWEVVIPPLDDLLAYPFDSGFVVGQDLDDEEELTSRLIAMSTWSAAAPGGVPDLRMINLSPFESFGFDRVRGVSLGGGVALQLYGVWSLRGAARAAPARPFITGELGFRREDASGSLELLAVRRLAAAEPWTPASGLGASLRAAVLGHDDRDWHLAEGGEARWRGFRGRTGGWRFTAGLERHASVVTSAGWILHDYQPNPAVTEGWMTRVAATRTASRWASGVDVLAGAHGLGARGWVRASAGPVRALLGATAGDVLPQQRFRLGGPWTVRGLGYGERHVERLWAVQADWPIPLGHWIVLIPFGDLAGGFDRRDPMAGVGLGVGDAEGLVRADVAVAVRPRRALRVDLGITLR